MPRLYTIGHSTRAADEFVSLLGEHSVDCLVDVRRFPGSRRHPHFASEALAATLERAGIDYLHEPDLGGYRKSSRRDSPNGAWRSAGFQAYADYMDSTEFRDALARTLERAREDKTVIMCAEAVPWRCHRRLISDAAVARGFEVRHILGPGRSETHELNPAARILDGDRLIYPDADAEQMGLFGA